MSSTVVLNNHQLSLFTSVYLQKECCCIIQRCIYVFELCGAWWCNLQLLCIFYYRDSDEEPVTFREAGFSKFGKYVCVHISKRIHLYLYMHKLWQVHIYHVKHNSMLALPGTLKFVMLYPLKGCDVLCIYCPSVLYWTTRGGMYNIMQWTTQCNEQANARIDY